MERQSLLRELRTILADYVFRLNHLGPETFRLRGESFEDWQDRKVPRIKLCLKLLEVAVEADEAGRLDEILRELARAPDAPVPSGLLDQLVEAETAALRARVAALHREHPDQCLGEGCPCRG